jgi:5-methylcytosine-specific restriction protein A
MSRSVPEWIGKTPDSVPPPRVRLRIFENAKGRCHISGRPIRAGEAWQCDHIIALINGGANVESNLAPALTAPHKVKTKEDLAEKSKVYRKRAKHLGIKAKRKPIQSAGFKRPKKQRTATRPVEKWTALSVRQGDRS